MPKKDPQAPDYEKVTSIEEVDGKIQETRNTIARKYKLRRGAEEQKKDMVAGFAAQIKHLKEELDFELEVLSGWEGHRLVLSNGGKADEDKKPPRSVKNVPLPPSAVSAGQPPPPPPGPQIVPLPPAPPVAQTGAGPRLVPFPVKSAVS